MGQAKNVTTAKKIMRIAGAVAETAGTVMVVAKNKRVRRELITVTIMRIIITIILSIRVWSNNSP